MSSTIEEVCSRIRLLLEKAVKTNLAEGILLSGGLDTSILAVIASKHISQKAFTLALMDSPAPDIDYATLMAKKLGLNHLVHRFSQDELFDALPAVIQVTKSFDPMEIRNSVTVYIGLKIAKENGVNTVATGDACDELLAGYSFLFGLEKEKLDLELQKLWDVMYFSSIPLAEALGIEAKLPYLDPEFKSFAMKLDSRYKVRTENGKIFGKWILRKAFEQFLPKEVAWRVKTPIEYGSGTTTLPNLFNSKISDTEFNRKRRKYLEEDKVTVRDKEHLFYYEIYRSAMGVPHSIDKNGKTCPQCNSNVPEKATFCRTCGAYPI